MKNVTQPRNRQKLKKYTELLIEVKENSLYYGALNEIEKEMVLSSDGEFWMDIFEIGELIFGIFHMADRDEAGWSDEITGGHDFFHQCYPMIKNHNGCSFLDYRLAFGCFITIAKTKISEKDFKKLIISLHCY